MNNENDLKIKNIRKILINKIELTEYLNKEEFIEFCVNLTNSLKYNRNNSILKYSISEIELAIDNMINFFDNINLTKRDIIEAFKNNYSFINVFLDKNFIDKYILLSVVENENNTVRKHALIHHSKRFRITLEELYARYVMIKLKNRELSINSMLETNYNAFIDSYIRKTYFNYMNKLLNNYKSLDQIVAIYPIDYEFIESLKNKDVNKNISFNKKNSKEDKINIVLNNYKKANNIGELSKLVNIPTSSIQRYLKNDLKKVLSKEEYQEIELWLQKAKKDGLSRGGINSQINNGYTKDEIGRFNGNKR